MQHDGFDTEILALNGRTRLGDIAALVRGARRDGPRTTRARRVPADGLIRPDLVIFRGR